MFLFVEERHIDGMLYSRLAGGRGWVFVTHDKRGVLCDRITPISKEIKDMLNAVQICEKRGNNARTLAGEKTKACKFLGIKLRAMMPPHWQVRK